MSAPRRGRGGVDVAVRMVTEDDAPVLARLLAANREHLAPWDPERPAD